MLELAASRVRILVPIAMIGLVFAVPNAIKTALTEGSTLFDMLTAIAPIFLCIACILVVALRGQYSRMDDVSMTGFLWSLAGAILFAAFVGIAHFV